MTIYSRESKLWKEQRLKVKLCDVYVQNVDGCPCCREDREVQIKFFGIFFESVDQIMYLKCFHAIVISFVLLGWKIDSRLWVTQPITLSIWFMNSGRCPLSVLEKRIYGTTLVPKCFRKYQYVFLIPYSFITAIYLSGSSGVVLGDRSSVERDGR